MESCALFACQVIKFLCTSSPKTLQFRATSFSQRLLIANFRSMNFNTFLLILKGLFLLSKFFFKKRFLFKKTQIYTFLKVLTTITIAVKVILNVRQS